MHNIVTIYRFNTPFLDIVNEKKWLIWVITKIENAVEFDWIKVLKNLIKEWNYYKLELNFENLNWKIEFYYISRITKNAYHLPIFKLNVFFDEKLLNTNKNRERIVKFLNNIFECFDWLKEREFLIDMDKTICYKRWFFSSSISPYYNFSDIDEIKQLFESQDWMAKIEEFIKIFSNNEFVLSHSKSQYFYKLHWIFLYFIYLVFLMYQNLENTAKAKKDLENVIVDWIYEWQIELMKKRLSYVEEQSEDIFNKYKNRLELFFKLF